MFMILGILIVVAKGGSAARAELDNALCPRQNASAVIRRRPEKWNFHRDFSEMIA